MSPFMRFDLGSVVGWPIGKKTYVVDLLIQTHFRYTYFLFVDNMMTERFGNVLDKLTASEWIKCCNGCA